MATNKYRLTTLLFVTSLFLIKCDCKKLQIDCTKIKYNFQLPMNAYPDKDSINIGDTIWLEIDESTILKDSISSSNIDYSGTENLGTVISFNKLITVGKLEYAIDKFKITVLKGQKLKQSNIDAEYSFSEENRRFKFKLAIVPEDSGIFRMILSNSNNTYRKNDECTKANFNIEFKDTQLHGYYYNVFDPNVVIDTSNKGNVYYFKVK
jgi:hypothetical protein